MDREVPRSTIFLASYLNFLLAALAYHHCCLIVGLDDLTALKFASSLNKHKRVFFLRSVEEKGMSNIDQNISEMAPGELHKLPAGRLQHVVSVNSWQHETMLHFGLLEKMVDKAMITTIVFGNGVDRPRSGAAVRQYFRQDTATRIDISDYPSLNQTMLSASLFTRK